MTRNPHLCKTRLRCGHCRFELEMCVRVRRGVPDDLMCDHVHGGGGGGWSCPRCHCVWPPYEWLVATVEDLLLRRVREWRALGAVHVELEAA